MRGRLLEGQRTVVDGCRDPVGLLLRERGAGTQRCRRVDPWLRRTSVMRRLEAITAMVMIGLGLRVATTSWRAGHHPRSSIPLSSAA
jgi:hypothetical protein